MPRCGSQALFCDVPIRFDTYVGCSHACDYCFVSAKYDISKVSFGESVWNLKNFIAGGRSKETDWCDWDIPLHWGGMSDPFQPAERIHMRSLECLKVFAETKYPVIISTKSTLLTEEPYRSVLKECNAVLQISLVSPQYDKREPGTPTYAERLAALPKLSPLCKRLLVRVQPFIPAVKDDIIAHLPAYKSAGVWGLTVEGEKKRKRVYPFTEKRGGDFCIPAVTLLKAFEEIKYSCHANSLKFYSGENAFRSMGDSPTCCGVDGLDGFVVNRYNTNWNDALPTESQQRIGSGYCFKACAQSALSHRNIGNTTFAGIIDGMRKKSGK